MATVTNDDLPRDPPREVSATPRLWMVHSRSMIHDPHEVMLPAGGTLVLGRYGILPDRSLGAFLARRHAELTITDAEVAIVPLNGKAVFVNGERVTKRRTLNDQDVIRSGDALFVFELDASRAQLSEDLDIRSWSGRMRDVWSKLSKAFRSDLTVVLTGPPGSGKEYLARQLHKHSPHRKDGPFLVVDCGSMREELARSELFGHEKGAFTGAISTKNGVFAKARGGDVFLDEVNSIPEQLQKDLLRVLNSRSISRVGSASEESSVDFRAIVATNVVLAERHAAGLLREDFWSRLGKYECHVPALRDRRVDLLTLLGDKLASMHGSRAPTLRFDAAEHLLLYSWSGNVRELFQVAERLPAGVTITARDVLDILEEQSYDERLEEYRARARSESLSHDDIVAALDKYSSQSAAAEALGISQPTISRRLKAIKRG